ncbi:tRNA lysidine(34) synthetase TilS [Azoarcus sp. DD4]|uniref:tRNA lysidine(34) synthetase TilS n=1 Tax=Azoarcus sp. DD4 TaxID=2027405 RepID=UPI0011286C14|nr:tRNA lysidine(34) synthetase TilS [Azoarcus sp. DD4]QDF96035.1 tRNA lysidine(34) synthetase TilS [Azoarcus sp. DD4]
MESTLAGPVAAVLSAAGIGPANHLCCALSGGVDSVVMFDLLAELRACFGYSLSAAHVHHGLSPNADDWADFCTGLCAARGVPVSVLRVDVPRDDDAGLEAAARRVRHAALRAQACDWLVFGHHQDDQAETLLFRLLRGTGLHGAAAMAAVEPPQAAVPGKLRPLLGLRRAEILRHARARGLCWVEDESNADCRFSRNALRHQVLPAIERSFGAAVPALARAAGHFREASDLLDVLAGIDEKECGGAMLDRERLRALSPARIANLLRWQVRRLGAAMPSQARLGEALRQLGTVDARHPLYLPLGEVACCAYRGRVWLEQAEHAPPTSCVWRGEPQLPWGAGMIGFRPARGEGLARGRLDAAASLSLQAPRPGLRLRLDARRPNRSFKNLCQEAGIPTWMRPRLPVLEVDGATAWIGGIGVAAEFRCGPDEPGVVPDWQP